MTRTVRRVGGRGGGQQPRNSRDRIGWWSGLGSASCQGAGGGVEGNSSTCLQVTLRIRVAGGSCSCLTHFLCPLPPLLLSLLLLLLLLVRAPGATAQLDVGQDWS